MTSLRNPARHPLLRAVARVLVAALVLALLPPLRAEASIPAPAVSASLPLREIVPAAEEGCLVVVVVVFGKPEILTKSAFGELLSHTGNDPQPYTFAGEPFDPNSGFSYNRARWMDPRVGRFLSEDPFNGHDEYDPPSLHKYLYVSANPINLVDPSGHEGEGGLVGQVVSLGITATLVAMEHPILMAAIGTVGMALLPEEVNNSMMMSGFPGLEALGEMGQAEATGIKLIKNAASESFAARELGQVSNRAGHAFEEFAVRWLFPKARTEVAVGKHVIDVIWNDFLIELKTGRILDARGRAQLLDFAKGAKAAGAAGLRYLFLNKPTQATIEFVEANGAKVWYLFE